MKFSVISPRDGPFHGPCIRWVQDSKWIQKGIKSMQGFALDGHMLHVTFAEPGAVAEVNGMEIEFGKPFTWNADYVIAELASGEDTSEQVDFDFVVGADGARGTWFSLLYFRTRLTDEFSGVVRKHLGLSFLGEHLDTGGNMTTDDVRIDRVDRSVCLTTYLSWLIGWTDLALLWWPAKEGWVSVWWNSTDFLTQYTSGSCWTQMSLKALMSFNSYWQEN